MDEPLYQQIINYLINEIAVGHLTAGSKLPTEAELSKMFFVSRITSKRALDELSAMNYVVRNRRTGTFVQHDIIRQVTPISEEIVKSTSKIIALIIPFSNDSYDATACLNGILSVTDKNNCYIVIQNSNANYKNEHKIFERCLKDNIGGIIFYPCDSIHNYTVVSQLVSENFPIVTIDKTYSDIDCSSIVSDNKNGSKEITDYLISMGHRNIAFLSNCDIASQSSVKLRYLGYVSSLKEHNLPIIPEYCVEQKKKFIMEKDDINESVLVKRTLSLYAQVAKSLVNSGVTAVQCCADGVAYLFYQGCRLANIEVPNQLSIAGFDHLPSTTDLRLTTTKQDLFQMGKLSAEILLEQMGNPNVQSKQIVLPVEFIEKSSVKRISHSCIM